MIKHEICPVSGETVAEERLNHLSHYAGLILSVIGSIILIVYTSLNADAWMIVGVTIYGITLVALYAASTYYHGCKDHVRKRTLRIVDHSCIYLLIAGTYTPFTLGPLRGTDGWILFSLEWALAVFGIIFKIYAIHRFQVLSTLAYLAMGWLVIFSWPTLMERLSTTTIIWVAAGGVIYTLGTLFYHWKSLPWKHAVWHVFVLGGSICHYFAIFHMV